MLVTAPQRITELFHDSAPLSAPVKITCFAPSLMPACHPGLLQIWAFVRNDHMQGYTPRKTADSNAKGATITFGI